MRKTKKVNNKTPEFKEHELLRKKQNPRKRKIIMNYSKGLAPRVHKVKPHEGPKISRGSRELTRTLGCQKEEKINKKKNTPRIQRKGTSQEKKNLENQGLHQEAKGFHQP